MNKQNLQKPIYRSKFAYQTVAIKRNAAFTLVELLVSLAVLAVVFTIGLKLTQSIGVSQKSMSTKVALQMEARRAFDKVEEEIREGTDVIRPVVGETLPFLIFKDIVNQVTIIYLEPNNAVSERLNKPVYKLMAYKNDYSGVHNPKEERVLLATVRNVSFTSLSPNGVQADVRVIYNDEEFEFLSHIGLMNIGGLE